MAKLPYTEEELKGFLDADRFRKAEAAAREHTNTLDRMTKAGGEWAEKANYMRKTMGNFTVTGEASTDKLLALKAASEQGAYSFESITSSIGKAVLKVSLWMVATTAVIGSIKKIQETLQVWKDLELSLERIGITTRTVGRDLYAYFEEAADVAVRMGMPIQQVMTGMNLALRATASIEDQAKRTATSQMMLRDAAILGNLAGMQFDQAINVLVGSLRQTGLELHEGIVLLDKWVAVSRSAGVSINDLSQGFAVMAAAAESAGVNIDQINGLIAALSEAVTLGPTEIGNAIRALMSTLYNPESVKMLQSFGIAARDASGEFRSFWDIMSELSAMESIGALNKSQILEISKAAGAGQRRYAQFQAILKNWNIAVKVSSVSANAQNEALLANQRIVNTLTNAWDQMSAAQNKFFYAIGEKSGMIEGLTKLMQSMAKTFDTWSDMEESVARLIKFVAQLALAFVAVKVAILGLTKVGLIAWFTKSYAGARLLLPAISVLPPVLGAMMSPLVTGASRTNLKGLIGRGSVMGMKPGMIMGWSHQAAQDDKGRWRDPLGKFAKQPTSTVTSTMIPTPITGGQLAKQSWAAVGGNIKSVANSFSKALIKPMGPVGTMFGVVAGGMIMQGLYKSDYAGWGGSIGAIIGSKFGVAGMAAGSLIGGAIGKAIEVSTSTAAQLMAKETERFFKRVPVELMAALRASSKEMDFSKTPIIPLKDLGNLQLERLQELLDSEQRILARRMRDWGLFGYGDLREPNREVYEERMKLPWHSKDAPHILDLEAKILKSQDIIAQTQYAIELLNRTSERTKTIYDEQSKEMLKIIDAYGLREAAEKKINQLIENSHNLSESFLESQIRLAGAMPNAQAKLLTQLQQFAPHLAEEFKKYYMDFDTFLAIDPQAYEPLQQALATLTTLTQQQDEYNDKVDTTRRILEDLGFTWSDKHSENAALIENQKLYWSELLDRVLNYGHSLSDFYTPWGLDTIPDVEQPDAAKAKLMELVAAIEEGDEALLQWVLNLSNIEAITALLDTNFRKISTHIPQGRLEFLSPDANVSQIQALLDKYEKLFEGFIKEDDPETYHAFVRDEGVVQRLLATFEAQPEVWSAMLQELNSIEGNTAKMLEGEYNLPGWYHTPTRYWAIKSTGMTEGFGPAQGTLWAQWEKFLATGIVDFLKDAELEVDTENAEQSVNNLCDTIEDTANRMGEYIEGFDWSPWQFMEKATELPSAGGPWEDYLDSLGRNQIRDDTTQPEPSFFDRIFNSIGLLATKGIHWILGDKEIGAKEIAPDYTADFNESINSTASAAQGASISVGEFSNVLLGISDLDLDNSSWEAGSDAIRSTSNTAQESFMEVNKSSSKFSDALMRAASWWDLLTAKILATTKIEPEVQSSSGGVYNGGYLASMQTGGVVPKTGPYLLHQREVVLSGNVLASTNSILSSSYRIMAISQQYLSNINIGITGLRQEIKQLRQDMIRGSVSHEDEFDRATRIGYSGINSVLGVRR